MNHKAYIDLISNNSKNALFLILFNILKYTLLYSNCVDHTYIFYYIAIIILLLFLKLWNYIMNLLNIYAVFLYSIVSHLYSIAKQLNKIKLKTVNLSHK